MRDEITIETPLGRQPTDGISNLVHGSKTLWGRDVDKLGASIAALDGMVSFVLSVIFSSARSRAEIHIARAIFAPMASVVLIPRGRPILACAINSDEFFATNSEVLNYKKTWVETDRSHDPITHCDRQFRIKTQILLDGELPESRRIDAIFTLRGSAPEQRICSCTVVYDEAYEGRSPATLY